jgi:hypothetical protein
MLISGSAMHHWYIGEERSVRARLTHVGQLCGDEMFITRPVYELLPPMLMAVMLNQVTESGGELRVPLCYEDENMY